MNEKIKVILESAKNDILGATSSKELYDVKVKYLGKTGLVTELSKGMKDISKEVFVEYMNSQNVKGNIWFYVAYPIGIHQLETEMISQWREENLNKIKEEYYVEKSFVIKL